MVDWHYDIIAELPLELSQMILQYLPLHQCFQARKVSRKWKNVISLPSTIDRLLQDWYPTTDTGLCIPDGLSAESTSFVKAEHVDAFKTGRPFSMMTHALDGAQNIDANKVAYANGVIAWVDRKLKYLIRTLDLRKGVEEEFMTENRCVVSHVAMSPSILVGLSLSARCYVWDRSTLNQISLKLPSANFENLAVSGTTLAIASLQCQPAPRLEVFTWDLRNELLHFFSVRLYPGTRDDVIEWRMVIDSKRASIIFFELAGHGPASEVSEHLHFTRTTFRGEKLAQGSIELRCMGDEAFDYVACFFDIDGSGNPWPLSGNLKQIQKIGRTQEVFRIRFNFEKNRLEAGKHRINNPLERIDWSAPFFTWKDSLYTFTHTDFHYGIVDLQESNLHGVDMAPTVILPRKEQHTRLNRVGGHGKDQLLGDEIFLIHVLPSGLYVWCFDKNVRMANESHNFKVARKLGFFQERPP